MRFHIENMTCGGCARSVARAVQALDPTAPIEADPATRKVVVTSTRSKSEVERALADAGYPATPSA